MIEKPAGTHTLLKEAQPVPRDSANAAGRLRDPRRGARERYQRFADQIEEMLLRNGGRMRVSELQSSLSRIPRLQNALGRGRMSTIGFLNIYRNMFRRADGIISVTGAMPAEVQQESAAVSSSSASAATPAPPAASSGPGRQRRTDLTPEEKRRLRSLNLKSAVSQQTTD